MKTFFYALQIIHYYIDMGKNALAKKAIKLGLKQHPNTIVLKLLKAELMIFEGAYDEAYRMLKMLQAIEPTNEEIYIQQASIYSKKDNHVKAINALKSALIYTDDQADILSMIGMEYLFLDDFNEARLNFAKCLSVDFEDYSSLYNVIYCFDMESKHIEAITYLNNYINKDPYSEVAWHQLGRQHFILDEFDLALRAFDYAVLIDECFVGAYLEKAKTLEKLYRYEEAIENYKATIELDDPTSFAFLRIGICYDKLNLSSLAGQYYKKAVHEDPLLDKGWIALTDLNLKQGKFRKALFHINKAIEIDELNTLYWRKFAEINLKLNFFEEAAKSFQKCLELQDFELEIWIGLSDVMSFLGEYKDALKQLMKARTFFKDCPEIEYRICGLYYSLKNAKEGKVSLENALQIDFDKRVIFEEQFRKYYNSKGVEEIIKKYKNTSL